MQRLIILIFFVYITTLSASQDYKLEISTGELPPYSYTINNQLTGLAVDIVREIQKRVKNTQKIRVFPWNRGYNMTLKKKGYALFTTARTKQREKLFKWVGPITNLKLVMLTDYIIPKQIQESFNEHVKLVKDIGTPTVSAYNMQTILENTKYKADMSFQSDFFTKTRKTENRRTMNPEITTIALKIIALPECAIVSCATFVLSFDLAALILYCSKK